PSVGAAGETFPVPAARRLRMDRPNPTTDQPTRPVRLATLAMAALCGVLFFYGLGAGELYRTENLRAIVAAEFLRTGNWVVPTLYGEPLFTKPPGFYAAIAAVSWPFGSVSDATARLPSALAAAVMALLFYAHFARRLGRAAGLVAVGMLPCSILWLAKVPWAEIDFLQVAWVGAAILCFFRALDAEEGLNRQGAEDAKKTGESENRSQGLSDLTFSLSSWRPWRPGGSSPLPWWLVALL